MSEAGEPTSTAAVLAGAVLEAEATRRAEQEDARREVLFADDLLPGVGGDGMSLRDGVRRGGVLTFVVLLLLQSFDELESGVLSVLAPDIRDTFHIGNGVIVFISAASGAFVVLGALPMGWLADRYRRGHIIGAAAAVYAVMLATCGLAVNAFTLFLARFGAGVAKSSNLPVNGSLVADSYPIQVRGRVMAFMLGGGQAARVLSPAAVGAIAAAAGGIEGWRWAYLLLGLPVLPLAVLAFRLPEPPRGQFEMQDVLGEVVTSERPVPVSIEAAFDRLLRIRTLRQCLVAFSAMGFGIFTGQVLQNLYLEERFGLGAAGRGVVGSVIGAGVVAVLPFAATWYDRLYRDDPAKALRLVGTLIMPVCVLLPLQYAMPNAVLFTIVGILPMVLLLTAFTMTGPILQSVVPYRLRGMGQALGALYIFFIGATGGALVAAFFTDAFGPRTTILVLTVPTTLFGGWLIRRSATSIKSDLSMVVAELREELDEHQRRSDDPASLPAIQVRNVDFSYGHVQVLFDVGFDVQPGEVLALLGTNGAGKSTILRAIAGLGTPSRGVVRLHGSTITYATPEHRVRMGIRLLAGGHGVFPDMTVLENLEMAAYLYRRAEADRARRIDEALARFPVLGARQGVRATDLSGGQQQMLALAMTLLHEPEILLVDELSLGLSPIVVQELLGVLEQLKAQGTTIVVVEQSLNVALAIADRAVFLEKGRVRFDGSGRDLLARDDLARAVFLGHEEG